MASKPKHYRTITCRFELPMLNTRQKGVNILTFNTCSSAVIVKLQPTKQMLCVWRLAFYATPDPLLISFTKDKHHRGLPLIYRLFHDHRIQSGPLCDYEMRHWTQLIGKSKRTMLPKSELCLPKYSPFMSLCQGGRWMSPAKSESLNR